MWINPLIWPLWLFSDCAGDKWKTHEATTKEIPTQPQTTGDKQPGQIDNGCYQCDDDDKDNDDEHRGDKTEVTWQEREEE